MIHWHPDEATLVEYSAGNIPIPYGICISVHLSYCSHCRSICNNLDALGASLFESDRDTVAVSDGLLASTMDMLDQHPVPATHTGIVGSKTDGHGDGDIPHTLSKMLGKTQFNQLNWRWRWPKLHVVELMNDGKFTLSLYKIAAGGKMPAHEHRGEEITLVLGGSFSDRFGTYSKGDMVVRHESEGHTPIASQSEECFCLVVESATPFFSGFKGKILNTAQRVFGSGSRT